MRSIRARLFGAFFASRHHLSSLRRWQSILASMHHNTQDYEYQLSFQMLGAHLSLEDGDERAFRESFRFIYYPNTDAELVAFAIQAASWAGVPNTF